MNIEIERNPSKAEADLLSRGIKSFNEETVRDLEPAEEEKRFHVMARDDEGSLQGGIRATCYWNTLHIELLWISETARGAGIGRKLMQKAEAFARE